MFEGFHPRMEMEGFTSIPNQFFDEVLESIESLAELKILLTTFRKTYGWISHVGPNGQPVYKQSDKISYSQFSKATGLSSPSVSAGIDKAIKHGYMERISTGSYGGFNEASEYRIRVRGRGTPPPEEDDTPPDFGPSPVEQVLPIQREYNERQTNGLVTKGVEPQTERASLSDFGFATGETDEPKPRTKKERARVGKERKDWNCNDLLGYYRLMFDGSGFKVPFGHITGKERSNAKTLVDEYGPEEVAKTVDWFFRNRKKVTGLPDAPPHFNIFYGFFKTIYAQMNGAIGRKTSREFDADKHDGKDGVNTW